MIFAQKGALQLHSPRLRSFSSWQAYGLAVLITAAALAASVLLKPFIQRTPAVILVPAILLSAWFGGIGPGILSAVFSALGVGLFLFPPSPLLLSDPVASVFDLVAFALIVLLMSTTAARTRSAHARAELAAERTDRLQAVAVAF